MLGLGLPERAGGLDLGDDLAGPEARGLDVGDRVLGDPALLVVDVEDRRAVAQADVVPLPVQRRRVVDLEEELEQVAVRGLLRVEDDLDRLGMRPVVAVGRVRRRRRPCSRPASRGRRGACGSGPASPRSTRRRGSPSPSFRSSSSLLRSTHRQRIAGTTAATRPLFRKNAAVTLHGNPIHETARLPDGRKVTVRVGILEDPTSPTGSSTRSCSSSVSETAFSPP